MNGIGIVHTFLWLDLGYTCEMIRHQDHVSFIVFRIHKRYGGRLLYQIDANNFTEFTDDTGKAMHYTKGIMNWDGCLDFFSDNHIHFCHIQNTKAFAKMVIRLHNQTYAMMSDDFDNHTQ